MSFKTFTQALFPGMTLVEQVRPFLFRPVREANGVCHGTTVLFEWIVARPILYFSGLDIITAIRKYHKKLYTLCHSVHVKMSEKIAQSFSSSVISWIGFRTEPDNLYLF